MGINAKDFQVCACRVMGFTMKTCQAFAVKHPLASGVTFTSLLLYLILPSIFNFLLYASPVIIGTIVYMSKSAFQPSKKDENNLDTKIFKNDRVDKQKMQSQLSVRKNARKIFKEWDVADGGGTSQSGDFKPKLLMDELKGIESSSCNVENVQCGGDSLSKKSDQQPAKTSAEVEVESSDDKDETREDGNKVVEWNEDDKKNPMDLGDSEIERNKRLENLIAKRRARKLFKMQIEKVIQLGGNIPPSQIAPVLLARTINPSETQEDFNIIDCLDTPCSAPSIMLPSRNPFDLPYEPHEEKPNLMADSFQQEFTAAQQKDMFFCRHESFSRGPLEQRRAWNDFMFGPHSTDQPPKPIFRRPPNFGEVDQISKTPSQESEPIHDVIKLESKGENRMDAVEFKHEEDRSANNNMIEIKREQAENSSDMKSSLDNGDTEAEIETNSVKDNISEPNSPSSIEGRGQIYNEEKRAFSKNLQRRRGVFPPLLNNPVKNSPIPSGNEPLYYSSPIRHNKSKMEERSFYTNRRGCHTPSFSIASDMQVEVSEVSSPPAIIDEASSSPDRDSLTYDGDIDQKGHSSGDEDMWTSFNARSTVANDALQDAIVEEEFSRKLNDPITSLVYSQDSQHLNDNSSSSKNEISQNAQSHSHMIRSESCDFPDPMSLNDLENKRQLIEDSLCLPPQLLHIQNLEGPSNPHTKAEEVGTIIEHMNEPVVLSSCNVKDLSSMKKRENEDMIQTEQGAGTTSKTFTEENYTTLGKSSCNEEIIQFNNQMEGAKSEGLKEALSQIEDEGNSRSMPYDRDIAQVGVSGVDENLNDHVDESSIQPEQAVDQVPVISSPSSSPRSVLQLERLQSDRISLQNFDNQIHIDILQSGADDIMSNNQPDEQTLQTLILHQNLDNTSHSPFDHQPNDCIAETSEVS